MKQKKILNYIIAALFVAAALTFFVPLITLSGSGFSWSGSMKEILGYIDKAVSGISMLGSLFMDEEEAMMINRLANMKYLLYVPYLLAVIGAIVILVFKKVWKNFVSLAVSLGNVVLFVGIAFMADAYLESYLGESYYRDIISIWKVLGIGYWVFVALQAAAAVLSVAVLVKRESSFTVSEGPVVMVDGPGLKPEIEEDDMESRKKVISEVPVGMLSGLTGEYKDMQITLHDNETIVIGRDGNDCNLVVSGSKVSRRHCSLSYFAKTNRYILTDFSSNGTFLGNGKRIQPNTSVEIMPGTVIYLGNRDNSFQIG